MSGDEPNQGETTSTTESIATPTEVADGDIKKSACSSVMLWAGMILSIFLIVLAVFIITTIHDEGSGGELAHTCGVWSISDAWSDLPEIIRCVRDRFL